MDFIFDPDVDGPVATELYREWYPHRHLWFVVLANLRDTLDGDPAGLVPFGVPTLLVTHSCFEGYLNFAGELLFDPPSWAELSRRGVLDKLASIARELSVELDAGKRPVQTVKKLDTWRNEIMHARIKRRGPEKRFFRHQGEIQSLANDFFGSVTRDFIDRAHQDVEDLCDSLQAAAHNRHQQRFDGPASFAGDLGRVKGSILRRGPEPPP